MPYKISFYGERKDELVPDTGGKELYDDYQTGELPDRVEIRAGLTVERRTIREIEYVRGEASKVVYTRQDIQRFEQDKLTTFLNEKGGLSNDRELKFLESEGLIRVERHQPVCKTASDCTIHINPNLTNEYGKMIERLSQWKLLQGKRNYAKKMEAEELDKVAASMKM